MPTFSLRPDRALLLHAAVVAALASILAVTFPRHAPDTQRFLAEASNLATRGLFSLDGETPTVRDFPAVPFILAGLLRLGVASPETWMRVLNGLCLGATALGAGLWIRAYRTVSGKTPCSWPIFGVWAIGLTPELLGATLFVLTESLYTALFLWSHLLLWKGWSASENRPTRAWWAAGGFGLGCVCLTRPLPLAYLPFLAGAAWILGPRDRRRHVVRSLAAAFLVMVATVAPWTFRNYTVTGVFIPVAYGTGVYLYVGASQAWNAEWPDFDPGERRSEARGIPLHEADRELGREALAKILEDPVAWFRLLPLKLKRFWWDVPGSKRQIESAALQLVLGGMHAVVMGLAMAGAWQLRRHPFGILLCAPLAYTCLAHCVLYAMPRFRVPVEPYLVLLAVVAVERGVARLRAWQYHKMAL